MRATPRRASIQAQDGFHTKSEYVMNPMTTFSRCGHQSCSVSSDALPPAAVVLTVKVRSVAKRRR